MKATRVSTDELLDLHDLVAKLAKRAKESGPYHVGEKLDPVMTALREIAKSTALDEALDRRRATELPGTAEESK